MIKYKFSPKSAIGGRKENQDSEGSLLTKFGFLCVVCDGMGGAAGGKTASKMAVTIILNEVANSAIETPAQALVVAIKKANHEIYHRSRQQPDLKGMGTTATALLLNEEKATIAHVGDSRVYQLRDGEKVFRTFDHSKVFEMVRRGILTEEQARLSEESNIIQRALGIAVDVDVEINDNIPFLKNDLFMLCTDGVCGALPENELLQLLKKEKDINKLAEKVIHEIDTLGYRQGGEHDNLTVSLVQPLSNSKLEVIIDMKTKMIIYGLSSAVALLAVVSGYLFFSGNTTTDTSKLENEIATLKQDTTQLRENLRRTTKERDELNEKMEIISRVSGMKDSVNHSKQEKQDNPTKILREGEKIPSEKSQIKKLEPGKETEGKETLE